MPPKTSITTRKGRNVTKKNWRDKLLPECLEYLEAYKLAAAKRHPLPTQIEDLSEWLRQSTAHFQQVPTAPGSSGLSCVVLDGQFIALMKQIDAPLAAELAEGENELPAGYATMLETAQKIALPLEADPNQRASIYFALGFLHSIASPILSGFRQQQFGKQPLDPEKMAALGAQVLEFVAKLLRGKWDPPKGRVETELAALVNCIEEHSIQPLTPDELHKAIAAAGVTVTPGESWRIRLHRMRSQGLVRRHRRTNEVEVILRANGTIDWGSMDARARNIMRKIVQDYTPEESSLKRESKSTLR